MTEEIEILPILETDEFRKNLFSKTTKLQTSWPTSSGAWRSPDVLIFEKTRTRKQISAKNFTTADRANHLPPLQKRSKWKSFTTASATRRTFVRVNIRGITKWAVKAHGGDELLNGNSMRGGGRPHVGAQTPHRRVGEALALQHYALPYERTWNPRVNPDQETFEAHLTLNDFETESFSASGVFTQSRSRLAPIGSFG